MNKYQRAILGVQGKKSFYTCSAMKSHAIISDTFDYDADVFKVIQDDLFSTQFEFTINANPNIKSCEFFINGKWHMAEKKEGDFLVVLDFNNRVETLKLTFADHLADDYVFTVQYTEVDKDLYYQKQAAEQKAKMLESAQIKHSTGIDLINIFFRPCCSAYEYTEVHLYIPQSYVTVNQSYAPVKKPSRWQLVKKCKVSPEDYYFSLNGLAYGTYAYVLKQYDKSNNLLLETDYIAFSLGAPKQPVMGKNNRI